MAALAHDFQPITDMRASAGYRLAVARNPAAPVRRDHRHEASTRLVGDRSLAHV